MGKAEKCPNCGADWCHVKARDNDGEIFLERMICLKCNHRREIKGYGSPQHLAMRRDVGLD